MKLKLSVDPPVNGRDFRPNEAVQGHVEVHSFKNDGSEATPNVRIVFQGAVRITLKPRFNAASQMAETYRQERYVVSTIG
jgi:hypothetical protein